MTRYSRSVIPGRQTGAPDGKPVLDSMVFGGAGKKGGPAQPIDDPNPDFLPPVDEDEADLLVGRANIDRRNAPDRRKGDERRRAAERREASRTKAAYAPLREDTGGYRAPEGGQRGPVLLVGALLIVAVFAVVVWSAYREGFKGEDAGAAPELAGSGVFKRPPVEVRDAPIVPATEDAEVLDALDGAPVLDATGETRPVILPKPAPVKPAPTQPAETRTAALASPPSVQPAPLKAPPTGAVPARPGPATTAPVNPALKPEPVRAAVAVTPAVAPAPAAVARATTSFVGSGSWLVQVAATSSEPAALAEWTKISKASPDLFTGAERFIQPADVNGKSVYRVRVGSFASKADATAFCAAFKAKGGNCYPAAK